jgi:hypothetical protein
VLQQGFSFVASLLRNRECGSKTPLLAGRDQSPWKLEPAATPPARRRSNKLAFNAAVLARMIPNEDVLQNGDSDAVLRLKMA